MYIRKLFLAGISAIVLVSTVAEAQQNRYRRTLPGRQQMVDLNMPTQYGYPFMAETAPDNAIINRRFRGDIRASQQAVDTRAQQICSLNGRGQLVNYELGFVGYNRYVTIAYGWRVEYVTNDLIQPFKNERGQIVGYPSGYVRVTCMSM
jgi:hypothetical protein